MSTQDTQDDTTVRRGPRASSASKFEAILRKSAEVFARNGYHATGITELLGELGISRGSLYYHIESKEELLYEICRAQLDEMNGVAKGIVALDVPADERFVLLARAQLRNISENLASWTVFFQEPTALTGERGAIIFALREEFEGYWLKVLREGTESGTFSSVNPVVVKGILGMLNYAYLWYREGGRLSPEDVADLFSTTLLDGLRRGQAAD